MAVVNTLIGHIKGPKGDTGETGATGARGAAGADATVTVGSTTTVPYGQTARVTNVGTPGAAVFNFTIPQGKPGEQTTKLDALTLDALTEPSASFPVPAVGDNGSTLFGKISKFFSDIKQAIVGLSVSGKTVTYTRADGTTGTITTQDTTYSVVSKTAAGLAPQLPNETITTKYLRQDGSWQVPPNTTYGLASTSANGLLRQLTGHDWHWMRGDGTWQAAQNNATTTESGYVLDARMGKYLNDKKLDKSDTGYFCSRQVWPTNCNDCLTNGWYMINSTATNVPPGLSKAWGILLVWNSSNTTTLTGSNWVYQIFLGEDRVIYFRNAVNSKSFSSWVKI